MNAIAGKTVAITGAARGTGYATAAALQALRLVLPEMVARRAGHIVNIASLAGAVPVPGQVVYAGHQIRGGRPVHGDGR